MAGELSQIQGGALSDAESIDRVIKQHNLIRDLLKKVLRKDTHYGEIPGTRRKKDGEEEKEKYVLLKPGAEKISFLFQMVPSFEFVEREPAPGHREYETTCTLRLRGSDVLLGQGVGVCSSMESKYRYRWDNTNQPVPQEFWETRDLSIIGGDSFAPRKAWVDGENGNRVQKWMIFQKIEHSDPSDTHNTVKKMSKKRAFVDAVITVTACSDLFEQDTIDEDGEILVVADADQGAAPQKEQKSTPQRKSATPAKGGNGGSTWRGQIESCSVKKKGKNQKGEDFTLYSIRTKDGRVFGTFSDTAADVASGCSKTGEECVITYERDDYGDKARSVEIAGLQEPKG